MCVVRRSLVRKSSAVLSRKRTFLQATEARTQISRDFSFTLAREIIKPSVFVNTTGNKPILCAEAVLYSVYERLTCERVRAQRVCYLIHLVFILKIII